VTVAEEGSNAPSSYKTFTVAVSNVAPTLSNLTLNGNTGTACATNNVTLAFSFDDPAKANDTYTGTIDWGDGSSTNFGSSFSINESHNYNPGTYTIKVNVKDEDGGQATPKEAQVSRQYQVTKLLDPVNPDGTSVFNAKSTIPLKVNITDCANKPVQGLKPSISFKNENSQTPTTAPNEAVSTQPNDTNYVMRDAGNGQYIYNLAASSMPDKDATYSATIKATTTSTGVVTQKWGLRSK
jgi:hypothetical protein